MTVNTYTQGQRWLSEAEPDLGLGLIIEVSDRMVTVAFLATDEERVYAQNTAPLSRVQFRKNEVIRTGDGWSFTVQDSEVLDGLIIYHGQRKDTLEDVSVFETRLAHDVTLNQPEDRLFTYQIDSNTHFELRYETLKQNAQLQQSPIMGLLGPRIDAIAHQLFIAHEVGERPAPRVLLADEVGLGKTIEAGLILHHQIITERAKRALIVVPKALVSQWVLELSRRFNLNASIIDESCFAALYPEDEDLLDLEVDEVALNPFEENQLVICTLDFLVNHPEHAQKAMETHWDTLIVDEAHHLQWSENKVSPEYQTIERLSRCADGLLLLTATPEQLGVSSHFARLRLLDPNRFHSLEAFLKEEETYAQAANAINVLQSDAQLSDSEYQGILNMYPDAPSIEVLNTPENKTNTINALLDRHGTGRVLFRNTRAHIQGFPKRQLITHEVDTQSEKTTWLMQWLKSHKEKVLIICATKEQALELEQTLHLKGGILCAAFHEDLTLLARDRSAAWFAEDMGAQALICSEIGSEGRNFQFAHHLVLFDLPSNPDLLEQRIGRLDRIGQTQTIQIHLILEPNTTEYGLYRWYHEGLNAFETTCPAARSIKEEFTDTLESALDAIDQADLLNALIKETQTRLKEVNSALEAGRDKLLELSSFNEPKANALRTDLLNAQDNDALVYYLDLMCDGFGIEQEPHSDYTYILNVGTHYRGGFKDISDDGITVTLDRNIALSNDDFKFITWEHPLIRDSFDQILTSRLGNTAMGTLEDSGFEEGTLLVECLFVVQTIAPKHLQLGRYMPPQLFRIVIDNKLQYVSKKLPFSEVKAQTKKVPRSARKRVLEAQKPTIQAMLKQAQAYADKACGTVIKNAHTKLETLLKPEIDRLTYLKQINPSVREAEITAITQQYDDCVDAIDKARIELNGVRVLIAT